MKWHNKSAAALRVTFLIAGCIAAASANQENPAIICHEGILSVDALNVKPEALFTALGQHCKIDIVAHGDVFPDQEISVSFENLTVNEGVKKLVKACAFRNYLIYFQSDTSGKKKFAKLELFMHGSGTRLLTKTALAEPQQDIMPADTDMPISQQMRLLHESGRLAERSSFTDKGGIPWDGSAPLGFPEFLGTINYAMSSNNWQDEAKAFSQGTMSTVPPAVRDIAAEFLIKTCDEIARERDTTEISQDIAAEAFQRIARSFKMPPMVMRTIPQSMSDLEQPRILVDLQYLKPEYRQ